jgi:hypothetical protein
MSTAWGTPDAQGIAVGLDVAPGTSPLAYKVSIANRSTEKRQVVLFATLDGKIRTRIVARQGGKEETRPAIMPARPVTSNYAIQIELAPGQVVTQDGSPATFELKGNATVRVVHGGVPNHPAEVASGEVTLEL